MHLQHHLDRAALAWKRWCVTVFPESIRQTPSDRFERRRRPLPSAGEVGKRLPEVPRTAARRDARAPRSRPRGHDRRQHTGRATHDRRQHRRPLQVAVATTVPSSTLAALARQQAPGGTVVVAGSPESTPLLADRPTVDGHDTAYVCRGFVCDRPVTDEVDLRALLGA